MAGPDSGSLLASILSAPDGWAWARAPPNRSNSAARMCVFMATSALMPSTRQRPRRCNSRHPAGSRARRNIATACGVYRAMNAADVPCVLVVESEVLVRLAVAAYLRECGFKVVEVGAADEAQRVLQSDVAVDVVLCEVDGAGELAGGLDGFGLAQWLRRERPQVKIILTSGVRRTAQEAGALCEDGPHLAKPYDHRNLERHIRQLLARES